MAWVPLRNINITWNLEVGNYGAVADGILFLLLIVTHTGRETPDRKRIQARKSSGHIHKPGTKYPEDAGKFIP